MNTWSIDPDTPTPVFEQLKHQVADRRTRGDLRSGDRLPPVRRLADELGIAPNTVARAYRELEAEGVIETRGRAGSFITATSAVSEVQGRAAARDYVSSIRQLGLGDAEAERLVREALAE